MWQTDRQTDRSEAFPLRKCVR